MVNGIEFLLYKYCLTSNEIKYKSRSGLSKSADLPRNPLLSYIKRTSMQGTFVCGKIWGKPFVSWLVGACGGLCLRGADLLLPKMWFPLKPHTSIVVEWTNGRNGQRPFDFNFNVPGRFCHLPSIFESLFIHSFIQWSKHSLTNLLVFASHHHYDQLNMIRVLNVVEGKWD